MCAAKSLWILMFAGPFVSGRHWFLKAIHHLWLLKYFCPIYHIDPQVFRKRIWWRHPIYDWVLWSLSFYVWPSCGICVSFHLLQEEASLIRDKQGTDQCIYVVSLGIILLLCSFIRKIVVGFPLGAWPILSWILGHFSRVRNGFHFMQWTSNPIRKWLVIPRTFGPLSSSYWCKSQGL